MRRYNICIEHITGERNIIANSLSRIIFEEELPEIISNKLGQAILKKDEQGNHEWFWKDGKGQYEEMLRGIKKKDVDNRSMQGKGVMELVEGMTSIRGMRWD